MRKEQNIQNIQCKKQINIVCIVKEEHSDAWQLARTIKEWFDQNQQHTNLEVLSSRQQSELLNRDMKSNDEKNACHAILVLGGDGTMLSVARTLYSLDIPLLGINFGKVGFLMEVEPVEWKSWIIRLLETLSVGHKNTTSPNSASCTNILAEDSQQNSHNNTINNDILLVEEHYILECEVVRDNTLIKLMYAVNDAVIARASIARTISLSIGVDNNHLSDLRCDGFIVSTPLGATAYAFSAHGPLALPGLDAQILTPICPFANSFPPCVVSGSSTVNITVLDPSTPVVLTLDGQDVTELKCGDKINISSRTAKIKLFVSDKSWYSKRLAERGFIRDGIGIQHKY